MKLTSIRTKYYNYSYQIAKDFSELIKINGSTYFHNVDIFNNKIENKTNILFLLDIFVLKKLRFKHIGSNILSDLKNINNINCIILIVNIDIKEKSESELTHFYFRNNFEIIGYNQHYPIMGWFKN